MYDDSVLMILKSFCLIGLIGMFLILGNIRNQ
jgi:hypothetical protein